MSIQFQWEINDINRNKDDNVAPRRPKNLLLTDRQTDEVTYRVALSRLNINKAQQANDASMGI